MWQLTRSYFIRSLLKLLFTYIHTQTVSQYSKARPCIPMLMPMSISLMWCADLAPCHGLHHQERLEDDRLFPRKFKRGRPGGRSRSREYGVPVKKIVSLFLLIDNDKLCLVFSPLFGALWRMNCAARFLDRCALMDYWLWCAFSTLPVKHTSYHIIQYGAFNMMLFWLCSWFLQLALSIRKGAVLASCNPESQKGYQIIKQIIQANMASYLTHQIETETGLMKNRYSSWLLFSPVLLHFCLVLMMKHYLWSCRILSY